MADDTVPSSSFTTDDPGNGVGDQDTANRFNICQRSGMRAKPGSLVREPITNLLVLPEYVDPYEQQLRVRDKAELLTGSIRAEPADNFITSISDGSTL